MTRNPRALLRTLPSETTLLLLVLLSALGPFQARAASAIYRSGVGARARGLAGADVALADQPLSVVAANPAGAGTFTALTLDLGFTGALPEGRFSNVANNDSPLDSGFEVLPEGAFVLPLGQSSVALALGVFPKAALSADWRYVDAPGGADGRTSYGLQTYKSELVAARAALGAGWALTTNLSVGASLGLIYDHNTFQGTYVFQTQPLLKGAKTLLDLDTAGFGVDGQVGLLFQPVASLQLGLAYKSPSWVNGHGDASGNAGVQLANLGLSSARPDFHYDAEVEMHFPQQLSFGLAWQFRPRWRLLAQVDWINWSDAFDALPVTLTGGNNADLNRLLGSSSLEDRTPLDWKDQWVYRAGLEYTLSEHFSLRAGYSFGNNPVPASTLTPLSAVISEHLVAAGLGYALGRFRVDLAYQYDFPNTVRVGTSALRSGEYSNSSIEIWRHSVALTVSTRF